MSRRDRAIALGMAILVASVSFSLLTAAVSTGALHIRGTVAKSFRPAYDIIVRPKGAASPFEKAHRLVNDNYLAATSGGITIAEWKKIEQLPGVSIAAPIANIGYVLVQANITVPIGTVLSKTAPNQLYRVNVTWVADNDLSRFPGGTYYAYYTPTHAFRRIPIGYQGEVVPGRKAPLPICGLVHGRGDANPSLPGITPVYNPPLPTSPLETGAGSFTHLFCFSGKTPAVRSFDPKQPGVIATFTFPMLLSAIDPTEEAKLLHLNKTIVSGHYLKEGEGLLPPPVRPAPQVTGNHLPVIVASRTYLDETLHATIERLTIPPTANVPQVLDDGATAFLRGLSGDVVGHRVIQPSVAWASALGQIIHQTSNAASVFAYWTTSPPSYSKVGPKKLRIRPTTNKLSIWAPAVYAQEPPGFMTAPPGNQDTQFGKVALHNGNNQVNISTYVIKFVGLHIEGRFSTNKLPGFNPLSRVPLQTYYPPTVTGATSNASKLLGNQPLGPDMNLGGFVSEPPLLLTTITAAEQMLSTRGNRYANTDGAAPISSIRIRVAGVTGDGAVDRARILAVATEIEQSTHLTVNVTAGSSPTNVDVTIPAGHNGRPPLEVAEGWVKEGVSVVILNAVDNESLVLFLLVLLVCAIFLGNGAFASVRARRSELGVLSGLGWGRREIFLLVLGELGLIGLLSGMLGAVIALSLALGLGLKLALWHAALVVPVAVVLALVAGLAPALSATRGRPLDAVYPVAGRSGRRRAVHGPIGLAWTNLIRQPARLVAGALGLFFGVAAFAILLAIELSFRGTVVGSLLGNAVSVQVRGVDLVATLLSIVLGAVSVADVLAINLRERATEGAVLAASGWSSRLLARVAFGEGLGVGLTGAIAGGLAGLGIAAGLTGDVLAVAAPAALATVAGVAVVVGAISIPSLLNSRRAPAVALAEE